MKRIDALIILFLMAANCLAQTDSLTAYLETAWRQNPSLRQKGSEYQAALQKVPQASALPDPSLSLGFFLQPMELPGGNQVADLQLMQMFPWFGVLKNARSESELMARASFFSVQATRLDVAYDVRTAWYELFRNRERFRLTMENLELLGQLERLAGVRYGAGELTSAGAGPGSAGASGNTGSTGTSRSTGASAASGRMSGMAGGGATSAAGSGASASGMPSTGELPSASGSLIDLYDLQQEERTLKSQLASLDDAFQLQRFRFNKLLNRETAAVICLPESTFTDPLPLPSDSVLSQNPMLQMLAFERESLVAKRKMTERMGYPMVGIGLKYSVLTKNPASTSMMNGQDMLMPMLSVSLPIFRKKYKAAQQQAAWEQTASEQGYEAARDKLQTDYEELKFQYREAERRLLLAESQLQLTAKAYALQRSRFAASTGSLEDLFRLGRRQLDEALQVLDARTDLLVAQAGIRRITAQE